MIEIIDQLVQIAKEVFGKAYRSYPMKTLRGQTYAVVTPMGRFVLNTDENHEEINVMLSYGITMYAESPEKLDDLFQLFSEKLIKLGIQSSGYSPTYQIENNWYSANATYQATVDKRGLAYR